MTATLNGRWDAAAFFENLCATNRLAQSEGFTFCRVSGLDGFEEAVNQMQSASAFVCVSDIADGYTELNNTPRTRRVKTVFFAMRHAAEDTTASTLTREGVCRNWLLRHTFLFFSRGSDNLWVIRKMA